MEIIRGTLHAIGVDKKVFKLKCCVLYISTFYIQDKFVKLFDCI